MILELWLSGALVIAAACYLTGTLIQTEKT
jgi:hypothetical protein